MGLLRYIGNILKLAFRLSFGMADTISGFVVAILYGIGKLFKLETIMNIDWWWLPFIVLGVIFAVRLLLAPYWLYKKIERERNELLNVTSKNGVIVVKQPPKLVIRIDEPLFGVSGDNGFPPCDFSGQKARWLRLSIAFRGNVYIETLGLSISGKKPVPADGFKSGHTSPLYYYFQIPDWVKSKEERTIQVQAFANGINWGSSEKIITFPV